MEYLRLIFVIISLTYSIKSTLNSYPYLVNLDLQILNEDITSASYAIQSIPKAQYKIQEEIQMTSSYSEIDSGKTKRIILREINGIFIDSLTMSFNGKKLSPGNEYLVIPSITPLSIPSNYYEGYTHSKDYNKIHSFCMYMNTSPTYQHDIIKTSSLKSIINTKNSNFGLDQMKKMKSFIYDQSAYKISDMNIGFALLEGNAKDNWSNFNSMTFKRLFLLDCFYDNRLMIAAVSESNDKIYIMKIEDLKDFKVYAFAIIDDFGFNAVINQMSIKDLNIYIALNTGLYIGTLSQSKYTKKTLITSQLDIIDLLVNSKTIYIINNKGFHIFDIAKEIYLKESYINHPHLTRLDYISSKSTNSSPYSIGIAVNNSPPDYKEIFIELLANEDHEIEPKLNKVFITTKSIEIEDVTTDKYSGFTYIFDRATQKMYVLTRAIPYIENTIHYAFNLSKEYQFSPPSVTDKDYISLMSLQDHTKNPVVVIMDKDKNFLFQEYLLTPQLLQCTFNIAGEYQESFNVYKDCSYKEGNKYYYEGCIVQYDFYITVKPEGNMVGIWIAVSIGVIVIIGIIIFVIFCRKCCNKNPTKTKEMVFGKRIARLSDEQRKTKKPSDSPLQLEEKPDL